MTIRYFGLKYKFESPTIQDPYGQVETYGVEAWIL